MKLTARQKKRRAYAQTIVRPRPPRIERPEKPARVASAPVVARPPRRTMPPLFYLIFGGFGLVYAVYYLVFIIGDLIHPRIVHGKQETVSIWLLLVALLFLALSAVNIYLGVRVWRQRRAATRQ